MNKELKVSFEILKKIYLEKSFVSIELNKYIQTTSDISVPTVTKIVYGVLEKDISLEYFISKYTSKLPKKEILILLKIVAYVSKALSSIPHFALVNEIVNIAKSVDKNQAGFVNAVSKKLIANDIVLPSKKNEIKYLSVKYNFPEWVIKELLKSHNLAFVTDLISKELSTLTHIRLSGEITSSEFEEKLKNMNIHFEKSLYDFTYYVDYHKLLKTELMKNIVVQGLPSIITANVLADKKGKILDVCSAPGGKSVYLASMGHDVYSCDIHSHRVGLIKKYAESCGVKLKTFVQDATKLNDAWIEKFDYVLCDVPCSNLGVTRKKPDVFLNRKESDIDTIAGLQLQILENSANYVKRGGILQYSTCTIIDKENKDVINKFLKKHKDFELTEIKVDGIDITNDNNMYTFYPNLTNTEGFFIGRLKRL
ncbi:MAG: 16S rRNA (cytosine(967)-C(5))-methyltransferase RsmB [Clostridiales bacterium]|nr:16S rRNA (cytosine(967)-C(5))-methyltransferase RsmB [Clostridiales bacterium]